jgi:hypothetical protein
MRGGPMFEFLFGLDTQLRQEKLNTWRKWWICCHLFNLFNSFSLVNLKVFHVLNILFFLQINNSGITSYFCMLLFMLFATSFIC